jgi:hypothetical protein
MKRESRTDKQIDQCFQYPDCKLPSEKDACMDYFHGDVPDEELDAAVFYECSRQSDTLRKIAERKANEDVGPGGKLHDIYRDECKNLSSGGWEWLVFNEGFSVLLEIPKFPDCPWSKLERESRGQLLSFYRNQKLRPLTTLRPDQLESIAAACRRKSASGIAERLPYRDIVFTIDYTKSKKHLMNQFGAWLDLDENLRLLRDNAKNSLGTTGKLKDQLKAIAVARMFRACEFDLEKLVSLAEDNRKKDSKGRPRKFHDARKIPGYATANEVPLFSEVVPVRHACKRVLDLLGEKLPLEFTGDSTKTSED